MIRHPFAQVLAFSLILVLFQSCKKSQNESAEEFAPGKRANWVPEDWDGTSDYEKGANRVR